MGSSMRLTPWKRREGYQSWLEEFARFLQEKETVTGDKCMALLEEQRLKHCDLSTISKKGAQNQAP